MAWRRWFVEYNPLYVASALCILGGAFLTTRELPPEEFGSKLGVAALTQVYQAALLLGALLLRRAGQKRPAALLGLIAFVFLLDVTFDGHRLLSHVGSMSWEPGMRARKAVPASVALALLAPLKLWALARVFRLRGAGPLLVAGLAATVLPLLPYVIELAGPWDVARRTVHLGLFSLGAPLLGWALGRPAREWTAEGEEDIRVQRIAAALPFVVAGLFAVHAAGWTALPGLELSPAHAASHILAAALVSAARLAPHRPRLAEFLAWMGSASGLALSLFPPRETGPAPAAAEAVLTGVALLALARFSGLRLLLPALVCGAAGAYAFAVDLRMPLPAPGAGWPALLAVALLAGAAAQRDFRCLFASAVAAGASLVALDPAAADLAPLAALLAGTWLACWTWVLLPSLRLLVPFAVTASMLSVGAVLLWRDPASMLPWYAASVVAAAGAGFAFRRREFQAVGLLALGPLAGATRSWWIPQTGGRWGHALLALGFMLLSAGVACNLLWAARRRGPPQPTPAPVAGESQVD